MAASTRRSCASGSGGLDGIDEIVLSLTARGLTTGEVSAHFAEVYGAKVSKDTISRITEKVVEGMTEWAQPATGPGAVSSERCESSWCALACPSLHGLLWCLVTEAQAWPVVEFRGDAVELVGGPSVEVGSLREVLA